MIEIIYDLYYHTFTIKNINDEKYNQINFGFCNSGKLPVIFSNLSFGIEILNTKNEVIYKNQYPNRNLIYSKSNQLYLISKNIKNIKKGREYIFNLWVINKRINKEHSQHIYIDKPKQPYPSWSWNDELTEWVAPKKKPVDDMKSYVWNENNLEWTLN